QAVLAPALDRWVDIRRQIIKRPFLSTLEKFIKPCPAGIIAASAFHPPYGEKMLTIAERAGFPAAIVVRNGIEGSMAFALKRPVKSLLSGRQNDGTFRRHELTYDAQILGPMPAVEEQRAVMSAEENAALIKEYCRSGSSGDQWFDLRAKATCEGFRLAIGWL